MTTNSWQIAAGVLVGVVIGGVAVYQVGPDPIRRFIDDPAGSFRQLTNDRQGTSAPLSQKEQQRHAAEQAKDKGLRDQQARQLRVDQQRSAGGGGSEALEAADRKERAWNKYYKKPATCEGNPSNEAMTECANHYIRAKRQFEEAYAAGKL
jgi:hypothetical protein